MLIIGLLMVLAAAALAVGAAFDGGDPASVEILGFSGKTTVAWVFFAGVATTVVFLLGAWLITNSMARARKRRSQRKDVKHRHQDSVRNLEEESTSLRAENEKMAGELTERRAAADSADSAAATESSDGAEGHTENRAAVSDETHSP